MGRFIVGVCLVTVVAVAAFAALASSAWALAPDGSHGWYWQMPQPVGGWYYDVASVGQDVWAVGGTSIAHSPDAGATWQTQCSFPRAELQSVAFADEQHGLACGLQETTSDTYGPLLLRTDDGGVTWAEVSAAGVVWSLDSLSMTDADHAWMAGESGLMWTTTDGGATWTRHSLGSSAGSLAVATVDGQRGWAGGRSGRVWRTTNGGATWKLQPTGLPDRYFVTQLECTDADHVWASALDESRAQPVSRVLVSSDGGASWRTVFRGDEIITDLCAFSGSDAWVIGFRWWDLLWTQFDSSTMPTVASVRHTVDGGESWTTSTISSSLSPCALDGDDGQLCAVGAGVFTSSDGGAAWVARTTSSTYSFTAAAAVAATDVWAIDETGSVLRTTDGVRWAEQDVSSRWSQSLDDVSFPDADHGWMVGSTGGYSGKPLMLTTSDGGQTWTHVKSALTGELTQVDFVDAQHGWVSGGPFFGPTGGPLERTTDGGLHWKAQPVDPSVFDVRFVDFVDANVGWVEADYEPSGFRGGQLPEAVFHTTDGGATWTRYALPKKTRLSTMQFLSATEGWAVSDRDGPHWSTVSDVVHTTDGGQTWTNVPQLSGHAITTLYFLDAATGWVAVYGEGIFGTTDGGATWTRVADDEGGAVAIVAGDDAHVWALGSGLIGTVDSSADTAPPTTWADADDAWRSTAQTITLSASDVGGSEPIVTEYSLDRGATWQDGASITFDAPADHSGDGFHSVLYRSRDAAGNREASQPCAALIDTLGPVCDAPKKAVVNSGASGILRFMATDATSGVSRATITISDMDGRVRRTFVEREGIWSSEPAPTYYWLRFTCDLKPGYYRIAVKGEDFAGNEQTTVGHNYLHVMRVGAPKQVRPWWPAGLPDGSMTGGGAAAARSDMARLLAGGLRAPGR